MLQKHPPNPNQIRKIPKKFSWVDHRLVREKYIQRCSHKALALYLFLITVADIKGLSYYAESSIKEILSMNTTLLQKSREELIQVNLIAYKKPIYQVLPLDNNFADKNLRSSNNRLDSISHILKQIMEASS